MFGLLLWCRSRLSLLMDTERTMLLSFSGAGQHVISSGGSRWLTQVQHISPSAGIEPQRGVAGRTELRVKLFDVFVEAGLVRDMAARKL